MTKDELQALAKQADAAVSTLETIVQQLEVIKEQLETKRDNAKETYERLVSKRDEAQEKYDSLSETAAEGPRGQKLQERIEQYTEKIESEIEPGYTLESIVESLESEVDALSFLDDFTVEDVRSFADQVDGYADVADDTLLALDESSDEDE